MRRRSRGWRGPFRVLCRGALVLLVAGPLVAVHSIPAVAAPRYRLIRIVSGLNQPVYMTSPPGDDRYFIVEKRGIIRIWRRGSLFRRPFLNITSLVSTGGERGLLSMAFDPGFASNRRFYVYYTNVRGTIVVARFLASASNRNRADPSTRHALVRIGHSKYSNHNGGQLQFDPIAAKQGRAILYFATGDGGGAGDPGNNAQNKSSRLGKLFRMDVGVDSPKLVMVAYGLRNPWRFSFDRLNGHLRLGDVGQSRWEELDFIKYGTRPGINFGWRKYEGRHLYRDQRIDESRLAWPFLEYSHVGGNCSVIGGYTYRGKISSLYGHYLYADLCSGNIWMRKPGRRPVLMNISGQVSNIVSFAEGNLGGLFLISLNGSIYRVVS